MSFNDFRYKKIGLQIPEIFQEGIKYEWPSNTVEFNNDGPIARIFVYDTMPQAHAKLTAPQSVKPVNIGQFKESNVKFKNERLIKTTLQNLMAMHNHKFPYFVSLQEYEFVALAHLDMLVAHYEKSDLVSPIDLKKFALEVATTYFDPAVEALKDSTVDLDLIDNYPNKNNYIYAFVVNSPQDSKIEIKRSKFDKLNSQSCKVRSTNLYHCEITCDPNYITS
jgi:hypothetical protein